MNNKKFRIDMFNVTFEALKKMIPISGKIFEVC